MNIFLQAILRAFIPVVFSLGAKWMKSLVSTVNHTASRPYIDQIFDVLLGFARDPQTPVASQKAETVITSLRTIVYSLLGNGAGDTGVKPWRSDDKK